jgi:hypothetical protein
MQILPRWDLLETSRDYVCVSTAESKREARTYLYDVCDDDEQCTSTSASLGWAAYRSYAAHDVPV